MSLKFHLSSDLQVSIIRIPCSVTVDTDDDIVGLDATWVGLTDCFLYITWLIASDNMTSGIGYLILCRIINLPTPTAVLT